MKQQFKLILVTLSFFIIFLKANANVDFKTKNRGLITDYDQGAPKTSKWVDLFAETPNYRAFGEAILSGRGEKFRWNMGPMFYRGRLTPESVKVFVIGQEGAQDENLSNRSFTGSTGTRMQKFLNYFGITQSYLFMNTFVYTITGQYSLYGDDADNEYKIKLWKQLMWMAQDEKSVIVSHRHKMFNYMLETNKKTLKLIIGVGTAGKESTVTWLNSISPDSCSYRKLTSSFCEGQGALKGVLAIGVRHPGAASARNAGSSATGGLIADFKKKASIVATKINSNPGWLKKDVDGTQNFSKEFSYGYASIPHRDFAFGTPWVLGDKGTTSNRRGSNTIQVFSDFGCYNNGARVGRRCMSIPPNEKPESDAPDDRIHYLYYKNPRNLLRSNERPVGFTDMDLPFEPPKNIITRRQYDEGPKNFKDELFKLYLAAIKSTENHEMIQHVSFGPTGMYRGNTEKPEFLIVADQQGHTDMFSGRALTGESGQRLQGLLNAAGLQNKYLIIRTLPVDCLDDETKNISCENLYFDNNVKEARENLIKSIVEKSTLKAIISVGDLANKVLKNLNLKMTHYHLNPNGNNAENAFHELYENLKRDKITHDESIYKKNELAEIPRSDLPYSSRWWMGTSGDRVSRSINMINVSVQNSRVRSFDKGSPNGNYYKLYAPTWATKWEVNQSALTPEELKSITEFKKTGL